jgi:hypothetical protein
LEEASGSFAGEKGPTSRSYPALTIAVVFGGSLKRNALNHRER